MIWIELMGPAGIGKSYWYQKFVNKYPEFEPKSIALMRIYNSSEYYSLSFKKKCIFFVYRLKIFRVSNYFKNKLFDYFFSNFQRKSKGIFPDSDNQVIRKYLENIDFLNEPQIVVLKNISYFNSKLTEFKFYQYYLNEHDLYLAEDGLLHLSPIFIQELEVDRLLIFEKKFDGMMNQRLGRAKKKSSAFIEYLLDENSLKNYIEKYSRLYHNKLICVHKVVSSSNVKTINLDKDNVLEEMYKFMNYNKLNL